MAIINTDTRYITLKMFDQNWREDTVAQFRTESQKPHVFDKR